MKRILTSILMIALLAGVAFGITYDADYYAARKSWTGAQNNSLDPLYLFMNEVGLILHEEAGTIYYVDNNSGDDTDDGLSWDKAFLTITYALAASHTNIATSPNYADRNIIYVRGDDFDEDLTDLAQKTDVIGVGSDDGNKGPRLLGNHTIDAVATGYNYMGCRFINMTFVNQTAADIFVVPTGHHGLEWIGCRFESNSSVLAPSAIDVTACNDTRIVGCEFISSVNMLWSGGAIDFGAGLAQNTDILGNYIDAVIGITIDSSTTGRSSRIAGNTIHSTTLTIDDNGDVFHVTDNILITDGYGKTAFDFNLALAARNTLTTAVRTVNIPYTNDCAGAVAAAQRGAFGTIYYVDGNMSASGGDGLTWETACQSLVAALAKSHANIAVSAQRNWAARNTIYVRGDAITEDFTKMAQKTDVVGVGSHNSYAQATIIGTWAIPDTTSYAGCRFYNLQFYDDGAGGVLWDVDTQSGTEWHECIFHQNATDTIGLLLEECINIEVDKCRFTWTNQNGFSTAAIQVVQDTDVATGIRITNNLIKSGAIGIDWDETSNVDCWIVANHFYTGGMCVDSEDVTNLMVNSNRMKTALGSADNTSNDFNILFAIDNIVTGSADTIYIPSPTDF